MSDETILIHPGDSSGSPRDVQIRLRVTQGPHTGATWTFAQDATVTIGRQAPSQIKLPLEKAFSREHLLLKITPPQVQLTDNDSSNGTWVNGVRLVAASLVDGDCFGVGETEIRCEVLQSAQVPSQSEPGDSEEESAERTRDHSAPTPSAVNVVTPPRQSAQTSILQTRIASNEPQPSPWNAPVSPPQAESNMPALGGYLLQRPLTRDQTSTLYKAKDCRTQTSYLVKVFQSDVTKSEEAKKAFFQQAAVLTSLDHPRILKTLEFGIEQNRPFLVMESIDPLDLLATIDGQSSERRILTATWVVSRLLQAVHCAHQHQIVHRRIHPSNIFGYREGRHLQIKLGNFEPTIQDRINDPSSMTHDRSATTSQYYVSPEELEDASVTTPAVDLFACGCCLLRFATGKEPDLAFQADKTLAALDVATYLPPTLRDVIRQSIDVDPARRFTSAESFAEAIFPFHQRV
ncbi:serine/threonine protein kinase [Rhodopirellula maiorica SM1]|uniref:Serine/threonine protein kinase n=1 Tax=Rhodopirellula maiorica SM1 TaxID=1265738 RepID=M5RJL6_9BACT|nr:serine/threonine-protein kinase [Rhodopirellula maiorica]EMI19495.1 serine/threonine protein kinase [Rhodopirellula maiorica SM1]